MATTATIPNYSKYIKWLWVLVLSPFWGFLLLITLTALGLFGRLPSFAELDNPKSNLPSEVFSGDGKMIARYYLENRSMASYEQISSRILNALIATEDVRFKEHSGVDYIATGRVLFKTVLGGNESSGGGSTITQQLAKNLFPRKANMNKLETGFRKLQEWIIAIKLERSYTKNEIIAMYLNTVEYGNRSFGIRMASKNYFNKLPSQVNQQEAAMLVGLLKAPSYYNPKKHYDRAKSRRNTVLEQMHKYNYLSDADFESLKATKIELKATGKSQVESMAPYFTEYLKNELTKWSETTDKRKSDGSKYDIYKDGLKIYTTIDSRFQKHAEDAVQEHMKYLQGVFFAHWGISKISDAFISSKLDTAKNPIIPSAPFSKVSKKRVKQMLDIAMKRSERYRVLKESGLSEEQIEKNFNTHDSITVFTYRTPSHDTTLWMTPMDSLRYMKFFMQAGFAAIQPQTGFVKAWVGGIDYNYFKYDHVKLGKRQVGSTFKPFVYATAVELGGYSPCTQVSNAKFCYGGWCPKNSGGGYGGTVPLKVALAKSLNIVSARLITEFNYRNVLTLISKMGIDTAEIPRHQRCPPLALGIAEIRLLDLIGAQTTFVNKGVWVQPTYIVRIEDRNGNVIEDFIPKRVEALSEQSAYLMIEIMKGVIQFGTSTRIKTTYGLKNEIAGKTGTTQNNSDGWFVGLTPDLTAAAWVGCEDRAAHFRSTGLGQGAFVALPIWAKFMKKVYDDPTLGVSQRDFDPPPSLSVELDCSKFNQNSSSGEGFDAFEKETKSNFNDVKGDINFDDVKDDTSGNLDDDSYLEQDIK